MTPNQAAVTADNFARAESDRYFGQRVNDSGLGRLYHFREILPIDHQSVVRGNRDTLYSDAVCDLDAGPVTVTLPDAGRRFMSLIVIDEDEYVPLVAYGAGSHTLSKDRIGTRYVMVATRIFVDPNDPQDLARVHALQDGVRLEQQSVGWFEVPSWDTATQARLRDALSTLGASLPDMSGAFGARRDVDPVRHLIGAAMAWGGNPQKDAMYLNVTPKRNDGTTIHRLTVNAVPVDGFWSISVYNAKGYYESNRQQAYTLNNITAKKNPDGSVSIQFGGCDGRIQNCLPIMPGWNYMVRLYRPHAEILSGQWMFPEAQPIE